MKRESIDERRNRRNEPCYTITILNPHLVSFRFETKRSIGEQKAENSKLREIKVLSLSLSSPLYPWKLLSNRIVPSSMANLGEIRLFNCPLVSAGNFSHGRLATSKNFPPFLFNWFVSFSILSFFFLFFSKNQLC